MTTHQNMKKQALDEAAKKYWEDYFKDYGKLWVRDIPRKITAHLATSVKKQASARDEVPLEGMTYPIWGTSMGDGSLFVEGTFKGHAGLNGKSVRVARFFGALFDAEGKLVKYEDTDVSSVIRD
ncbi:MAG: hypothetical protein ACYSUN_14660 [Planctomycetota bacterium]|jgi:hypothetical protein